MLPPGGTGKSVEVFLPVSIWAGVLKYTDSCESPFISLVCYSEGMTLFLFVLNMDIGGFCYLLSSRWVLWLSGR